MYYGNTGCGVFKQGVQNLKRFLPKIQHTQRKLLNFENWVNEKVSKSAKNVKNYPFFFIEDYQLRRTFSVIDIF